MGKGFAPHRVVIRDRSDRILSDREFEHFAAAEPVYREAAAAVRPGELVTLQHGARVIFKAQGQTGAPGSGPAPRLPGAGF